MHVAAYSLYPMLHLWWGIIRVYEQLISTTVLLVLVSLVEACITLEAVLVLAQNKAYRILLYVERPPQTLFNLISWLSVYTPSASFFNYALTAPELLWAGCPDD